MADNKISAGSYDLNKWLFGGYETDIITTIYGPAGSGKTNLCMLAAVSQAKKSKKVIYIDTEGGFSVDRFKQIAKENFELALSNVLILKPTNFYEQEQAFSKLLNEIKSQNIGLIVVDSMTMLYRLEMGDAQKDFDSQKVYQINKKLAQQLRALAEISRKRLIPIIVTNQVYYDFLPEQEFKEGREKTARMVGGDLLKYWSKCIIELKSSNNKRSALLKKHRSLPEKELQFVIVSDGIKRKGIF